MAVGRIQKYQCVINISPYLTYLNVCVYIPKDQMKDFQINRDTENYGLPLTWRLDSIYHLMVHIRVG